MQCSINRYLVLLISIVASLSVRADFNEATRAYLVGDFEKARYEALVAATDGKPEAQMLLGQLYFNGEGVEKDLKAALYWYEKAATQGFADAQYRLGSLYFDGKYDIPKDYDKAYKWLQLALDNGNTDAKVKLEGLFKTDAGSVVNLHESPEVLQQVAGSGNKQARFLYSDKLLKGEGYPQDKAKAVALLTEDAQQGFVKAQKRLGELYFFGDGVTQDYYEAYAWSMAYAGTKELGGLMREGKQTARSALRKLDDENHQLAYEKSKQYFEQYVLPFHKNAREVGPDKYRIVVRSRKAQLAQAQPQGPAVNPAAVSTAQAGPTPVMDSPKQQSCENTENKNINTERTKEDVSQIFDQDKAAIYAIYNRALVKNPGLKGRIEYEVEIDAAGRVTRVDKRAASTLNEPEFEAKLVERLKQMNFCAKGTKPFTVAYPIEFVPPSDKQAAQTDSVTDPVLARTMAAVERKQGPASGKVQVTDHLRDNVNPTAPLNSTMHDVTVTPGEESTPAGKARENRQADIPPGDGVSESTAIQSPSTPTSAGGESEAADSALVKEGEKAQTAATGDVVGAVPGALPADNKQTGRTDDNKANNARDKRSYKDVHNVFIRHKSQMNDLYLRAYEQDKKIRGRIVFELTIEPGGSASSVGVQSSELEAPTLEEELIDFIKTMDFGEKNSEPYEVTYPMDFLP